MVLRKIYFFVIDFLRISCIYTLQKSWAQNDICVSYAYCLFYHFCLMLTDHRTKVYIKFRSGVTLSILNEKLSCRIIICDSKICVVLFFKP